MPQQRVQGFVYSINTVSRRGAIRCACYLVTHGCILQLLWVMPRKQERQGQYNATLCRTLSK